jgi:hypothetical protein
MTKTGIDTAALHAAIIPALGVVPPSKSASHSSNRCAPPRSAASDDATESTQASTRIGASRVMTNPSFSSISERTAVRRCGGIGSAWS